MFKTIFAVAALQAACLAFPTHIESPFLDAARSRIEKLTTNFGSKQQEQSNDREKTEQVNEIKPKGRSTINRLREAREANMKKDKKLTTSTATLGTNQFVWNAGAVTMCLGSDASSVCGTTTPRFSLNLESGFTTTTSTACTECPIQYYPFTREFSGTTSLTQQHSTFEGQATSSQACLYNGTLSSTTCVDSMPFWALTTKPYYTVDSGYPYAVNDGIIGFGPYLEESQQDQSFLYQLYNDKKIDEPQFTIHSQSMESFIAGNHESTITLGYVPDDIKSANSSTQQCGSTSGNIWSLLTGTLQYGDTDMNPNASATEAIFSTSVYQILLPYAIGLALTKKFEEANPQVNFGYDDYFYNANVKCSEIVMEDFKVQLGDKVFTIPSQDYAVTVEDNCEINFNSSEAFGYDSNQIVLGGPFFVAYDVTFNNADMKVTMYIDGTQSNASDVSFCDTDGSNCTSGSGTSDDDGLDGSAIFIIILVSLLVIALVGGIVYYCIKKPKTDPSAAYEPVSGENQQSHD